MTRPRAQPPHRTDRSKRPGRSLSWTLEFGRSSSLGITFAATFLVFAGLGYLADRWIGTYPLLLALGLLLGAAGGFVKMVYTVFPRSSEGSDQDGQKP